MIKTKGLVLALATGLSGLAAAAPGPEPEGQGPLVVSIPPGGVIRIDPSALVMLPPEPPPTLLEQAFSAISDLRHDLEEFKKARTAYKVALDGCAQKSYTVNEMYAAGCTNNDTVAACSRKLLHACITAARRPAEKVREAALQELPGVQNAVRAAVALPDPPRP
jgi:hypothetical protein